MAEIQHLTRIHVQTYKHSAACEYLYSETFFCCLGTLAFQVKVLTLIFTLKVFTSITDKPCRNCIFLCS